MSAEQPSHGVESSHPEEADEKPVRPWSRALRAGNVELPPKPIFDPSKRHGVSKPGRPARKHPFSREGSEVDDPEAAAQGDSPESGSPELRQPKHRSRGSPPPSSYLRLKAAHNSLQRRWDDSSSRRHDTSFLQRRCEILTRQRDAAERDLEQMQEDFGVARSKQQRHLLMQRDAELGRVRARLEKVESDASRQRRADAARIAELEAELELARRQVRQGHAAPESGVKTEPPSLPPLPPGWHRVNPKD